MGRAGTAECRNDGSADDTEMRPFRAQPGDAVLHDRDDLVAFGIAVLAEVVDAFQPDQAGDTGKRRWARSSRSRRGKTTTRSYMEMRTRPPGCPWIRRRAR